MMSLRGVAVFAFVLNSIRIFCGMLGPIGTNVLESMLFSESALWFWVVVAGFLAIAGAAKCLEVAEVVGAALGEGNDVVYFKFFGAVAMLALVVIAVEDVCANFGGDFDAGWFFLGHGNRLVVV
jgi:hypothetical protein